MGKLTATIDIRRWATPPSKEAQDDKEENGYALIGSNLVLIGIVLVCFALHIQGAAHIWIPGCSLRELPAYCARVAGLTLPSPSWGVFKVFAVLEVWALFSYWVDNFMPEDLWRLARKPLKRPKRKRPAPAPASKSNTHERRKGLQFPLWLTAIPNVTAIAYLTWETGGPSSSPYSQILIALLITAQQAKIVTGKDGRYPWDTTWLAIKEYAPFIIIAAMFYLLLGVVQHWWPAHVAPARDGFSVLLAFLFFLISTVVNYVIGADDDDDSEMPDNDDGDESQAPETGRSGPESTTPEKAASGT